MALPTRHMLRQGKVIASLGRTAFSAAMQRLERGPRPVPELPGPAIQATVPPLPRDLVRDYVRHVGGDPSAYRDTVPPHLFPQWTVPLAARSLRKIPYPLMRVVNGGCRLEVNAPLPAGEPLMASARLEDIDDDGQRAVLHQRLVTGTSAVPEAVVAHLYAIVPLGPRGKKEGGAAPKKKRERPRVPPGARELAYWRIGPRAGLAFAMLTGDFNPIHWLRPYARAAGFASNILHGFATLARAHEGLNTSLLSGAAAIRILDVKFTRPLVLPARVGLYLDSDQVFVGDAPGGPAYLVGTCTMNG